MNDEMLDKDKIDTRVKETSLGGLMLTGYSGALYKTDVVSMETGVLTGSG